MTELPASAPIQEMEAAIRRKGHVVERTFTEARGWEFFVDGELVARAEALGVLQAEIGKWVHREDRPGSET